jgi:hypothetical protein
MKAAGATLTAEAGVLQPEPSSTEAPIAQPEPSPTEAPIAQPEPSLSEVDIDYFTSMLRWTSWGPLELMSRLEEIMALEPPEELSDTHTALVKAVEELMPYWQDLREADSSEKIDLAKFVYDLHKQDYEQEEERIFAAWDEYLSQRGAELPVRYTPPTFTRADDGWIVGSSGSILHYDGEQWEYMESPTDRDLYAIHMVSADEGWIVGDEYSLYHYEAGKWNEADYPSTLEFEDVAHWNTSPRLSVVSADDVWLLAFEPFQSADSRYNVEVFHYDGSSWTRQVRLTPLRVVDYYPRNIHMLDSETGWLSTDSALHWYYRNGTWSEVQPEDFYYMNSLQLLGPTSGWSVGDDGRIASFDGTVWTSVDSPTDKDLSSVYMVDEQEGWAVGAEGNILHYDGSAWSQYESPTTSDLHAIRMFSQGQIGWIRGIDDTLLRYDGNRWIHEDFPEEASSFSWPAVLSPENAWTVLPLGGIAHFDGTAWEVLYRWPGVVKRD